MVGKRGGHRSEQEVVQRTVPTRTHDEQIRIAARRSECCTRIPWDHEQLHRGMSSEVGQFGRHTPFEFLTGSGFGDLGRR